MIVVVKEVLQVFGICENQVYFELFIMLVFMVFKVIEVVVDYNGDCEVMVLLDGEKVMIQFNINGKIILDVLDYVGMDVFFFCKGGVCCICKVKIIEGFVQMCINFVLIDQEVEQGYIFICQLYLISKVFKIDYDV